jgi:hypothetical protein
MNKPATSVHPIHFEDLDGSEFERLVFAYHWRSDDWRSLEWYGQAGNDLGRDIWGVRDNSFAKGEAVCIQCVNRKTLTFTKIAQDIGKVLKGPNGVPDRFRVVAQSKISAKMRDKIKAHVKSLGVKECDTWSGPEFEEFLRHGSEFLLQRFFDGEAFPDAPADLKKLAESIKAVTDHEVLALYARVFDRPAFYTPIHQESNMEDFKQAITDTIQALGTGIWKARDGHLIDRIPSRHQLKSASLRKKIQTVEIALSKLRAKYDEMIRTGVLRHCPCNDPRCTTFFFLPHDATQDLQSARDEVIETFRRPNPGFRPSSW